MEPNKAILICYLIKFLNTGLDHKITIERLCWELSIKWLKKCKGEIYEKALLMVARFVLQSITILDAKIAV